MPEIMKLPKKENVRFDERVEPGEALIDGDLWILHCPSCLQMCVTSYLRDVLGDRLTFIECDPVIVIDRKSGREIPVPPYPAGHRPSTCACAGCAAAHEMLTALILRHAGEAGVLP